MIRVDSVHKLEEMEAAFCRVAQRHGAHILAVTPLGALLTREAQRAAHDAISFTICHTELYGALLAADIRFAAFLPCRIAAIREGGGVMLEAMSPTLFCRYLNRPDLERLVATLETMLRGLMGDAAAAAHPGSHPQHAADGSLGASEGQISMRGSIPQRIDCHGTKIEDLAGTGELDSPGG
jgi:uncharacterized protein (DUF302 family)